MRWYLSAFLLAILLCYGSDIAPYYAASLSGGELKVLGPLNKFEVPCVEFGTSECKAIYKVPRSLIGEAKSLGLGIILQPIEVFCGVAASPTKLRNGSDQEQISKSLNSYKTYKINPDCVDDILVENRLMPGFKRHGYSQGPVTYGNEEWVARTKVLVEVFQSGLALVISLLLIFVFSLVRILKKISGIQTKLTVFDDFIFFGVVCINFVYLAEVFVPITVPFNILVRISNACGFLFFSGPVLTFVSQSGFLGPRIRNGLLLFLKPIGKTHLISPHLILSSLFFCSAYFATLYPVLIILVASLGLLLAVRIKESLMILFCLAALSDASKILMIPSLPSSRLAMTFIALVIIYRVVLHIRFLLEAIRAETTEQIYVQLAHDIRSPVGALVNLLPHLRGDKEVTDTVFAALSRVREIAKDILTDHKINVKRSLSLEKCDISLLVKEVIAEKKLENLSSVRDRIDLVPISGTFFSHADPERLKRIISNLINNALEATATETGIISLEVENVDSNVVVSVIDNGLGFPKGFVEKFSVGAAIHSTKNTGTGLGLSYARRLLLEWGGTLTIESRPSGGSIVRVSLRSAGPDSE